MEKIRKIVKILPFLMYTSLFFLYGIYYVIMTSFGYNRIIGESGFTLEYYKALIFSKEFLENLKYTIKINLLTGGISLFLTIALLYLIYINRNSKYLRGVLKKVLEFPVGISYLTGAYALVLLLSRGGVLGRYLLKFGAIDSIKDFPILINDSYGIGIILGYIWKIVPFMIMMCIPIMIDIERRWKDLGALYNLNDYKFFKKIIFPMIMPNLALSFFLVLAYLFSAFETPYILGVTYPRTLSVQIYELYREGDIELRGQVMAINVIVTLIALIISFISYLIMKYLTKFKEREW